MQPEVKKVGTEQIKTKARASVLDKLNRKKKPFVKIHPTHVYTEHMRILMNYRHYLIA